MKNKIISVILISIMFMVLFINNSYAGYSEGDYPEITFDTLGFDLNNGYILLNNNGLMNIIILPDNFTDKVIYTGSAIYLSNGARYMINELKGDGKWNNAITSSRNSNIREIYFSTVNIYDSDLNVVFQPAPVEITQVLLEETTKAGIMYQIKTMIVGFLKYLIVLVVSVIAFYKGWKFLSTQLRKA